MDFSKNNKAIYLQIVDYVFENILCNKWKAGERIPSIRDLSVNVQVNPNTVMRTYNYLQGKEIIYNKRGIGFFISENAFENLLNLKRTQFIKDELPTVFKNLDLLGMDINEILKLYQKWKSNEEQL